MQINTSTRQVPFASRKFRKFIDFTEVKSLKGESKKKSKVKYLMKNIFVGEISFIRRHFEILHLLHIHKHIYVCELIGIHKSIRMHT